ncbi:MAG: PAS domain-containing protein [Atribacterota bacterium]
MAKRGRPGGRIASKKRDGLVERISTFQDRFEAFLEAIELFLSSGLEGSKVWKKEGRLFLQKVRLVFNLDWVGVFGASEKNRLSCYAEESALQGEVFPTEIALDEFPWFRAHIEKGEALFVFHATGLPQEAQRERDFLGGQSISSFFCFPLYGRDSLRGVLLGFTVGYGKAWLDWEKRFLEKLGRLLIIFWEAYQVEDHSQQEASLFRLILENAPSVIALKDHQSRFLWTSAFHLQIMGVSRLEDVVGKTDFDFFPQEEAQGFYRDEQEIIATGKPVVNKVEKAHFRDGTIHWMLTTKVPVKDENGEIVGILILARDITEWKEAEEKLDLERRFLLTVLNTIPDAVYVKDTKHRFVLLNEACAKHLGFSSPQEVIGKTDFDLHPPELARYYWEEEEKILNTRGAEINVEREVDDFSAGAKRQIWVLVHKVPVYDEHGRVVALLGINRDITERKEMEKAFLFERNLLRSIINAVPDHVYVKDRDHRFVLVNEADAKHHGFASPEDMVGKTDFDLHPPELARHYWEDEERIIQTGEVLLNDEHLVYDFSTGEKRAIWISTNKVPLYDDRGNIAGMVGVNRDITGRKEIEEALRASEREKDLILNALQEQVTYYNPDFQIIWVNQAVLRNFGLSPQKVIGRRCYEVIEGRSAPCPGCAVAKAFKSGKPEEGEVTAYNGTIWHQKAYPILDENGKAFRVVEISVDITERKKAEEQIRYLSFHDPLTGLYNRFFLQEELKRLDAPRQLPLSIIMGDVNNLKLVNDAFGHEVGDELLKRMASILLRSCRKEDIVARFGGDEFLILLPQTSSIAVQEVIERIRKLCREEWKGTEKHIPLSISLGYATKEREEENVQAVINEAESRMYRNKLVESRSARSVLIASLERSLWEISEETEAHSRRLRDMALRMGKVLGLPSSDLDALELLARLHDLGKLGVSRTILSKPGPLNEKEWEEIKKHPEIGYRIAQASPELLPVAEGILTHHERFDGSGYPQGLRREEIPIIARIISIIDAFDAMTSIRPYRRPLTREEALQEIRRNAGTQFDLFLVEVFFRVMGENTDVVNSRPQ